MTEGTSQGLFVVVAIVIFGIFVGLTYTLFGSEGLTNDLENLFTLSTEQVTLNNGEKVNKNEVIYFEDLNLESTIIEELKTNYNIVLETNKETGKDVVKVENMLEVDTLDISNSNIESLKGIEYSVNLEVLNASNNNITDIEPITTLSKLKTVDLSNNKIEYVNGIDKLENLKELIIVNNNLTNASVLQVKNLTNLETIKVDEPYPDATSESLFTYKLNDTGVTITDYKGLETDIVIPEFVNYSGVKYPVTEIGEYAFNSEGQDRPGYIKNYIAVNLTSVVIPDTVKVIGSRAFASNESLSKLDLGSGVVEIKDNAFMSHSIVSLEIPDSVELIGSYAFYDYNSYSLQYLKLGNNIKTIEGGAFYFNSLKVVEIPSSVTTLGYVSFGNSRYITDVTIPDNSYFTDYILNRAFDELDRKINYKYY